MDFGGKRECVSEDQHLGVLALSLVLTSSLEIIIACLISYYLVCLSVFENQREMFKNPTERSD